MLKRFSIGWKILSSLALLLILVVGANYIIFTTQKNRISEQTFNILSLINNANKAVILSVVNDIRNRTADFASDGFIRDEAKRIISNNTDINAVAALNRHLLVNKLPLDPRIYGINVVDMSGNIIASTDPSEIGKTESKDTYYVHSEDLTYGTTYSSDFESSTHFKTNAVALIIVAPLTDKTTGEHIGMLLNFVKADAIIDAIGKENDSISMDSGSFNMASTFVLNTKGFVVDKKFEDQGRLTKQIKMDSILQCSGQATYTNSEGTPVLGASLCLNNGWTIVTEIPESQALASIVLIRKEILIMVIALTVLTILIMYLLIRMVIDPIKILSETAKKLGNKNFNVRTHLTSKDELGDLSDSFDEMADRLQSSNKLLEKRIREVTTDLEKFKLAVEGASDHIIITDKEGVIIYANKAAEETTGYSRAEMIGQRPSLWGKQMPPEFYRRMWRTIKEEKQSFHGEITNKRKNGKLYIAESHLSPLFDEHGELYGFIGIERDITHQKEIDKSKTEFVSIASHQLRTPLTIINWYVEMLTTPGEETLTEKQKQYMDEITRASKRMIDLVNSLLNVSRIDMGTFMVDVEPVDFASAMDEMLKDLTPQLEKKKLNIIKHYDRTLPQINADPKLLRMIFQNLLTNAVKYTPDNGSITLTLKKEDANVLIMVADTGMGIPQDQHAKLFTKFFRADNARAKEPDGNGLGLYITKSLVENSNGKIWFESKENQGTTFYITLPLVGMQEKEGTRSLAL